MKEVIGVNPASPNGDHSCTVRSIVGPRFLTLLEDADDWCVFGGYLVIVNPNRTPRAVNTVTGVSLEFPQ